MTRGEHADECWIRETFRAGAGLVAAMFLAGGSHATAQTRPPAAPTRAGYSADLMAWSSWKRIAPLLLRNEITKRTSPFVEVLA